MAKTIRINNKSIPYSVSRRKVKYPRLEFKTGELLVVMPTKMKDENEVLNKHKRWIYNNYTKIEEAIKNNKNIRLREDISISEFKNLLNEKISKLSNGLGISVNRVFVKKMISKWGSMSSRKNITINSYAGMLPDRLIEYIVYHELAHLIEKRHNEKYWKIIKKRYNNYNRYENDLFKYWFLIQQMLH